MELIVAGRSPERAGAFARRLAHSACAGVLPAALDADAPTSCELAKQKPDLLINASGPYQTQDYQVARACIGAGVHYFDLADARGFVMGLGQLDEEAKRAD